MSDNDFALTEEQRFPLQTAAGRRLLRRLREHPQAPRFNHHCGDRLSAAGLARVQGFEATVAAPPRGWRPGGVPAWVAEFADFCGRDVPIYRRSAPGPEAGFFAIPTIDRATLAREPWAFVPDSQPLDELIMYATSGTTGHPLEILSHPETSSMNLPLIRQALRRHGLELCGGPDTVALILVCAQKFTFSFATLTSFLGEAGFIKLNLNPADWRDPADRARYLDACHPEVYSGDPLSFLELATLPLTTRPKALVSTAMELTAAVRARLETHFGCPVLDLYALNEAGPVALAAGDGAFELLTPDLFVEVLLPDGTSCAPGERGEIVLTGGRNPFLPLLRYRTGDWGSLDWAGAAGVPPRLVGLQGRAPVVFRTLAGGTLNNIDVTLALRPLGLPQFTLHQEADGSLLCRLPDAVLVTAEPAVRRTLTDLFGAGLRLRCEPLPAPFASDRKLVQYSAAAPD